MCYKGYFYQVCPFRLSLLVSKVIYQHESYQILTFGYSSDRFYATQRTYSLTACIQLFMSCLIVSSYFRWAILATKFYLVIGSISTHFYLMISSKVDSLARGNFFKICGLTSSVNSQQIVFNAIHSFLVLVVFGRGGAGGLQKAQLDFGTLEELFLFFDLSGGLTAWQQTQLRILWVPELLSLITFRICVINSMRYQYFFTFSAFSQLQQQSFLLKGLNSFLSYFFWSLSSTLGGS